MEWTHLVNSVRNRRTFCLTITSYRRTVPSLGEESRDRLHSRSESLTVNGVRLPTVFDEGWRDVLRDNVVPSNILR